MLHRDGADRLLLYRRLFVLAVLATALVLLWTARDALYPYALGLILAYALSPIVVRLERIMPGGVKRGTLRRIAAVFILYLVLFGTLALILLTVGRWVVDETADLLSSLGDLWRQMLARYGSFENWYVENVPEPIRESIQSSADSWGALGASWVRTPFTDILSSVSGVLGLFAALFFIPMFMFYLLIERPTAGDSFTRSIPAAWRADMAAVGGIISRTFFAYFRGLSLEAMILGSLTGFGFWVIGVPFAVGLGALTGLAVFIPYIGFWFAFLATIVVVLALEPTLIIPTLILSGVLQILDNAYMSPRFKGVSIGFTPAQTLVILALSAALIGPIGVIIGTPIAAVLRDVVLYVYRRLTPHSVMPPNEVRPSVVGEQVLD